MEEEELDALNEKMQMQYDLGCFIKDELVPNAVKYYTGEAIEDEEDDYDDDEEVLEGCVIFVFASADNDCRTRMMANSTTKMRMMRMRPLLHPKVARSKASRG
jgi:hypothetical protein